MTEVQTRKEAERTRRRIDAVRFGLLFPAIFIGRLVGLHVAQRHSPT